MHEPQSPDAAPEPGSTVDAAPAPGMAPGSAPLHTGAIDGPVPWVLFDGAAVAGDAQDADAAESEPVVAPATKPAAGSLRVATNGTVRLTVRGEGGKVFLRRGIKGIALKPPAEALLPHLNQLAGELLKRLDMPANEAVQRLLGLVGMVPTVKPRRVEWAVAELGDVRVYTDGTDIILTKENMTL